MNEYQKKCLCIDEIYNHTGITCKFTDLIQVNKKSSGDSIFAYHNEDVTFLFYVTYDGLLKVKKISW